MGFQSTVSLVQGLGVPGELFDTSPKRSQPFILNSVSAAYNVVGATAFTVSSQGVAAAGNAAGNGVFAGILANPKVYASYGTSAGGPLAPTMTLANQTEGELVTMGEMIVTITTTANIGDIVIFDNTTGALSTIVPGTTLPTGKSYANAYVTRFTVSAAGLAVININPTTPALNN